MSPSDTVERPPGHRRALARGARPSLGALPALLILAIAVGSIAADIALADESAIPSSLSTHSPLLAVAAAGERLVAVGNRGHIVLSDDGGATWRQARQVPTRMMLTSVCFADARRGWAVGHDAVILHTRDAGEVWQIQHSAPELESPLLSVWIDETGRGLAVGAFSLVLETRDGGSSWLRRPPPGGPEADLHLNSIFRTTDGALQIAAERGIVYRAHELGGRWQTLDPPYNGSLWGGLGLPDGAMLVFGMRGHVFRSADAGQSWLAVESGTDKSLTSGVALGADRVMLVGLGGVVLTSQDAGRRFALETRPDRRGLAAVHPGREGRILVFGETGVESIDD